MHKEIVPINKIKISLCRVKIFSCSNICIYIVYLTCCSLKHTLMKKVYILILAFFCLSVGYPQSALNTFNTIGGGYCATIVSDYQCLGINPANLGWSWDNHMINFGLAELGLTVYTNALTKTQVYNDLFNNSIHLDMSQRIQAASNFSDTRLWGQGGMTWLGLSVNVPKIGGFAFSVRDRFLWNTVLNHAAAQFIFLGYHDPDRKS